jgi:hypothetical protein
MNSEAPLKPKSVIIILVVIFATIGSVIAALVINNNIIQYSSPPKQISIIVRDGSKAQNDSKDSVVFNLAVIPKFPIGTFIPAETTTSNIIERNMLYHQNAVFPVWGMLIIIMITIASGSVPVFIAQIIQLKTTFNLGTKQVVAGFIYAIIILVYLAISSSAGKGYYNPPKIIDDFHILLTKGNILNGIVVATILLMLPAITVMFLIGPASDTLFKKKITKLNFETTVNQLELLNQLLENSLRVLSVIVVFSVLTSSALRESIKATIEIDRYDIFPTEVSYVYGLYFSLFLCVIYIPVYYYLKQQYNYLKTASVEAEDLGENKEKVLSSINLNNSAIDNIKVALTVLAPLLSSFLPENLHFLK